MLRTLIFGLLLFGGLSACYAISTSPAALPNGLRVLTRERHTSSLVAVDLWVRGGARDEEQGEAGAAHFLEHTLFKGTTTRRAGETDIAIENLGATLNAATGPDYAHFYTTVARAHLAEALSVLADVVRNATLPDVEVDLERRVILDELAQRDSDPYSLLINHLYAASFQDHPYRRPPGGDPAQIRVRGRDTLAAFYHRTYSPERCSLVLVGDLTPEDAVDAARTAFGNWARPKADAIGLLPNGDSLPGSALALQENAEIARSVVGLGFRSPAASDAGMACAALVTAAILGDSEGGGRLASGRLAGTDASVRYTPRRDESLFVLTAALPLRPPNRSETEQERQIRVNGVEAALRAMVIELQTSTPTAPELQSAKQRLLGAGVFDLETNAGLASALGYADITGGDPPELFRTRLQQLTLADLYRFIGIYLNPGRCTSLKLLSKSAP